MRIVDKREKLEEKEFKNMLRKKEVSRVGEFIELLEIDSISEISDYEEADKLSKLFENLQKNDIGRWITLDISTARGIDYYTGIVFEAFDKKNVINRSLLGGGRYDNLIEGYNGKKIPSSGFAVGYAPLEEALEGYNISLETPTTKVYIMKFEDTSEINTKISEYLRNQGYIVEENLKGNSISNQFNNADSKNYDYVIVPGPEEVSEGKVKIKNLEDGKEKDVLIESLNSIDIDSLFN